MKKTLDVAICQMTVTSSKEDNLNKAKEMIKESASQGAEMVILPEVFNSPYQADLFPQYAEPFPGPSTALLSEAARSSKVCVVGGSIVERDINGKIFNSSFVFNEKGDLIGHHRKAHLFDIDIPGQISFKESDTLTAGNSITIIKHGNFIFALMICFDCRFPELARAAALEGAALLVIPAAFNTTTGPAHWDLLMRCRAVDNQVFVAAASPARNPTAAYQAWGHSMIVDPWGTIIKQAGSGEEIIIAQLDFARLEQVRRELPLLQQRRPDLYQLNYRNVGMRGE